MILPRVLNKKKHGIPKNSVYVGRPSEWGNPYSHKTGTLAKFKVDSLEESIIKFDEYLKDRFNKDEDFKQKAIDTLRGKDLVCWCDGLCHAAIWIKYVNEDL